MYLPKHFEITDKQIIYDFINANPFGQLISNLDGKLFSTHIPFVLSEDKTKLLAHLARHNPQSNELEAQEVLVTLQGPHDYVSPSYYVNPAVPTWNYQVVHIYGACQVITDVKEIKNTIESLTSRFEQKSAQPWQPDYKAGLVNAIVGIEIAINEIQCKFKLSQNRSEQDRHSVIRHLEAIGSDQLAEAMRSHA